jgi:hypothetical protein
LADHCRAGPTKVSLARAPLVAKEAWGNRRDAIADTGARPTDRRKDPMGDAAGDNALVDGRTLEDFSALGRECDHPRLHACRRDIPGSGPNIISLDSE